MACSSNDNIEMSNLSYNECSCYSPSSSVAKCTGKCTSTKYYKKRPLKNTNKMHFDIQEQRNEALEMMEMMKRDNLLTDVILEVEKEKFKAHRIVLCANSTYFKAMFTSGLRESEMDCVKLQGIASVIMQKLLCFMYTGKIVVTELIVCQMLSAATMFQMNHVIDACCTFLEQQIESSNVIGIATFAQQHGCMDLYQKSNIFIEQHFTEVSLQEEFLDLTECQLINLIQKDELNVPDEMDVYNAVVKWVMLDEKERSCKMQRILTAVRCQYLSPRFLTDQMRNCQILRKAPACREYLAKIFKDLTLHKPHQQKARQPNAPCVIYIVGGYSNRQSLDTLECYSVDDKQWIQLSRLPVARSGLAAAYLHGIFYAIGGRSIHSNGTYHDCNWVDSFDPICNIWQQCSPMNFPRNRLGIAELDKELYVVGGANGTLCFNSVERFKPEENRWIMMNPMSKARMGVGVVVVNRLIYAIGGYDGEERLRSVECYYPELNEWKFVSPMQIHRSGMGICCVGKHVFVIGGYDGTNQLKSVEKYDTETDTWSFAQPLRVSRSAMTVSCWDSKIFVMGGYNGNTFLSCVEIYDTKKKEWEEGQPLPWGRSGHASASSLHSCLTSSGLRPCDT